MYISFFKEKDFTIEVFGLKPNTRYYLYINRIQFTSRTKQYGKKLGEPLITDKNGYLKVLYYFDSGIPSDFSKSNNSKIKNLNLSPQEIVFSRLNQTTLSQGFEDEISSNAKATILK